MTKILVAAALVGLLGAPATAQPYNNMPSRGNGVTAPFVYTPSRDGYNASAQSGNAAFNESNVVRDSQGNVIGADPDINIRSKLLRNDNVF
jgi:hypothetical protein